MDLQEVLKNKVNADRAERMKGSIQITLGELILKLENLVEKEKNPQVYFDFSETFPTHLHSWRGSYDELAIGWTGGDYGPKEEPIKLKDFIKLLKKAVGKTFVGWKGGDFVMGKATPIWVSNDGVGSHTGIVEVIDDGYIIILGTQIFEY